MNRRLTYYDVSIDASGYKGDAENATGVLFAPRRYTKDDAPPGKKAGDPVLYANGAPIRYTCGVTFISLYYAITAAHCLAGTDTIQDPDKHLITVRMYALGKDLIPTDDKPGSGWKKAAAVQGAFPDWTHTELTLGDGYVFDEYTCHLERRCDAGTDWGGAYNCPDPPDAAKEFPELVPHEPLPDVALLRCDAPAPWKAPGNVHGMLNVAESDVSGVPVFMPWKHEVYDISDQKPGEQYYDHYTRWYPPEQNQKNFHYHGGEYDGVERNQLLPLVSLPWDEENERQKTGYSVYLRGFATDLIGCHGTSGSGILQKNESIGPWELLGPVDGGDTGYTGYNYDRYLCDDQSKRNPGEQIFAYPWLKHTQYLAQFADDCSYPNVSGNPLLWLWCHRRALLPILTKPFDFQWPCIGCPPWERLRIWNEPKIAVEGGQPLSIPGYGIQAAVAYRASVRTVSVSGAKAPAVTLKLGDQVVKAAATPRQDPGENPRLGLVAARFYAERSGVQALRVVADPASGPFDATEIVLVRDGGANGFDTMVERAGVGLLPAGGLSDNGKPVEPMRFVGDGEGGYAPLLRAGERMVVTRGAFVEERKWKVGFGVSSSIQDLTCGLILSDGTSVTEPCAAASLVDLELAPPVEAQPVSFFIEAGADAEPALIEGLSMESRPVVGEVDEVAICHFPPGNPGNAHTIAVGAPALKAHLAHGDRVDPCPGKGQAKMLICHYPPGDPDNPETIEVAPPALGAHLAHGDSLGSCPWNE